MNTHESYLAFGKLLLAALGTAYVQTAISTQIEQPYAKLRTNSTSKEDSGTRLNGDGVLASGYPQLLSTVVGSSVPSASIRETMLSKIEGRLDYFKKLPVGWEHEDSQPAKAEDVSATLDLLRALPEEIEPPIPMISSSGTIGLFWDTDSAFAELELQDSQHFSLYIREKNGQRKEYFTPSVSIASADRRWFRNELHAVVPRLPLAA